MVILPSGTWVYGFIEIEDTNMAKKHQPPKPMFPLKHEFYASLDVFTHEAGMLADATKQILDLPDIITNKAARKLLQERLDAFAAARFGDEAP